MSGIVKASGQQVQFQEQNDEGCYCCCWLWGGPKKSKPTATSEGSVRVLATEQDPLIEEGKRRESYTEVPTRIEDDRERRDTAFLSQTPPSDDGYASPVTRSPASAKGTPGGDKDAEQAKRYWSQHASVNPTEDDSF